MVLAKVTNANSRRSMYVSDAPQKYDTDPEADLMELWPLDAATVLADYEAQQAKYSTAPFDAMGNELRFYPGGITIWSGFPGSGKTTLLRQMACHLIAENEQVFFASLEEHPRNLLMGIAGVAGAVALGATPSVEVVKATLDAYHDKLRIWGKIGIASHRKILATIRYLAEQGVTHAFIDSLMCLDIRNDDIEAQRQFAVLIAATAKASGVHIHLVAHPKKPMQRDQEVDISDVAGAKEIGGIADNVIFVQRGEAMGPGYGVPMKIKVRKQRYWRGQWPLYEGYFKHEFRQFVPTPASDAIRYLG